MNLSRRGISTSAILTVPLLLILCFSLSFVTAQVAVESYSATKNGDHTILTLKIHQDYIDDDLVEFVAVRLDGGEPIIQSVVPTSVAVITVEIDLGVLEGTPEAELSIYTSNYGWTPWFEAFEVRLTPVDYTPLLVGIGVVAVAVGAVYLVLRRKRAMASEELGRKQVRKRYSKIASAISKP